MRGLRLLLPLLLVAAAPPAASGSRPTKLRPAGLARIATAPALYPAYSPAIHDYVVRCTPGAPMHVVVRPAAGTGVRIDGAATRRRAVALKAGAAVTVEGRNRGGSVDYHVRCLPPDFPQFTETRSAATTSWYVLTPTLSLGKARSHYIAIFDGNGVPVWWYRARRVPIDAKILPGPKGKGPVFAFATFPVDTPEYQLRRLDGKLVRKVVSPDGRIDDHDLQLAGNGDYFAIVYQPKPGVDLSAWGGPADATVLEAEVEEISPDGKLVWSWTTDGRVDISATGVRWIPGLISTPVSIPGDDGAPLTTYDFFHPNAIALGGDTVLFSVRHTDAIYAIDKATGDIRWQLGGVPSPQRLTVVDDPYGDMPLGGQHDVRIDPDGTVTAFDDGSFLGRPPRAVRYRIDPVAHTATLVESISDPAVTNSICCGSARRMADGDWLISWGGDPVVGEYRPDGTPVFKLDFGTLFSYRAVPVAQRRLRIETLRAAMDTMAKR